MKISFSLIFILLCDFCYFASAQVITTAAGNGSATYSGDGTQATAAGIGFTGFIRFDREGNYYFSALNNTIRKVTTTNTIYTIAGNGTVGFSGDGGPATAAQLNITGGGGVAFDSDNNLYIADHANNRIRKVNRLTGTISTYAGTGVAGYSGDGGPSSLAQLNGPICIAFDSENNLYVTDGFNYRIRKINNLGIISTIAGTGIMGFSGYGGPAISADIYVAGGIIVGNHSDLFQADGIRVRKIDLSTGIISTIAGNGVYGYSGDGSLATNAQFLSTMDIALDRSDNLYVSDRNNHRIRMVNAVGVISTVTGNGIGGFFGDMGLATSAQIFSPRGVAIDICDNLYFSDNGNNRIRKVTFNPPPCEYLSVNEQSNKQVVALYPNPAKEEINIEGAQPHTTYRLCNAVGNVVQHGGLKQNSNTITINHLPPGLYLLVLTDGEGVRTVHKIVKE